MPRRRRGRLGLKNLRRIWRLIMRLKFVLISRNGSRHKLSKLKLLSARSSDRHILKCKEKISRNLGFKKKPLKICWWSKGQCCRDLWETQVRLKWNTTETCNKAWWTVNHIKCKPWTHKLLMDTLCIIRAAQINSRSKGWDKKPERVTKTKKIIRMPNTSQKWTSMTRNTTRRMTKIILILIQIPIVRTCMAKVMGCTLRDSRLKPWWTWTSSRTRRKVTPIRIHILILMSRQVIVRTMRRSTSKLWKSKKGLRNH